MQDAWATMTSFDLKVVLNFISINLVNFSLKSDPFESYLLKKMIAIVALIFKPCSLDQVSDFKLGSILHPNF
jgi:hypothetical protein